MNLTESGSLVFLLGLLSLSALAITAILLVAARALWRISRRLDTVLSHGDKTLRQAERTLEIARTLLGRTDKAAARVEETLGKACGLVEGILEQIDLVRQKAHAFWTRQSGNGTRSKFRTGRRLLTKGG